MVRTDILQLPGVAVTLKKLTSAFRSSNRPSKNLSALDDLMQTVADNANQEAGSDGTD